jgi:hypothetical protein
VGADQGLERAEVVGDRPQGRSAARFERHLPVADQLVGLAAGQPGQVAVQCGDDLADVVGDVAFFRPLWVAVEPFACDAFAMTVSKKVDGSVAVPDIGNAARPGFGPSNKLAGRFREFCEPSRKKRG